MPRVNYEVKNKIIEEYFNGIESTTLFRKYHISKSVILVWINRILKL